MQSLQPPYTQYDPNTWLFRCHQLSTKQDEREKVLTISRIADTIFTHQIFLGNLCRFVSLLSKCDKFDLESRNKIKHQLLFLNKVMTLRGFLNCTQHNDKILHIAERLLETSSRFEDIMSELGIIIHFVDDPSISNELLSIRDGQTVLSLYITKKVAAIVDKKTAGVAKNLLREFAAIVFTGTCGYNRGALYTILEISYSLFSYLSDGYLNHIRILLNHMIIDRENVFQRIFSSSVNSDPQLKKIIESDITLLNERVVSSTDIFRVCFMFLLTYIKQAEMEPNCYVVAFLTFATQNVPEKILMCVIDFLRSGKCKIGAMTISFCKIERYLLNRVEIGDRNSEFFSRADSSERIQLLQLIIGLIECQNCSVALNVKDDFIGFVGLCLFDCFESLTDISDIKEAQLLVNKTCNALRERMVFFPRYGERKDFFEDVGTAYYHRLLSRASIGIMFEETDGSYCYLNSFALTAQIIVDLLVSFVSGVNSVVANRIELFYEMNIEYLIDKLADYITENLGMGFTHQYVKLKDLVTFKYDGGLFISVQKFLKIYPKEHCFNHVSFSNFLEELFEFLGSICEQRRYAFLLSGFDHTWPVSSNPFFSSFCTSKMFQYWTKDVLLSAKKRMEDRMQRPVSTSVKQKIFSVIKISPTRLEQFNSMITYGEIKSFIEPFLRTLERQESEKIENEINIEFNKLIINLEDLRRIFVALNISFTLQKMIRIFLRLPKQHEQPNVIAGILRNILIEDGLDIPRFYLEIVICLYCDGNTVPIPIPLGDLKYEKPFLPVDRNDLVAMMDVFSGEMQLYFRLQSGNLKKKNFSENRFSVLYLPDSQ